MIFHRRILLAVTLPALGIGLLLGAVCALGVRSLNRLQADRSRLLAEDVASLEAAQELEVRLRQVRFHSFAYVLEPTPARKAPLDEDHFQFEAAVGKARVAANRPEESILIDRLEAGYRAYLVELHDRSRWPEVGSGVPAYLAWADAHPVRPLIAPCDELMALNRKSMGETAEANAELTGRTRSLMILLGTLGPLAGLVAGGGIAWGWSRSFTRLQLRIGDAQAELDRDIGSIRVAAHGDWRRLDRQMDGVLRSVRTVVAQLQDRQRELLRSERMAAVGHLAAGVAHEIRNPLTGAKLLIEAALRKDAPRPLEPDELRMILDEILRVERTVQGLLDFARPPSPVRRDLDLGECLRRAVASVCGRAEARRVRIALATPTGPATAVGDPDQLLASVANLLINAVEASPVGGEIRVALAVPDGGMMRLEVADCGPGIAPEMLGRLFTPFATDKPAGTGLGLCVARRIAREHGGDLTADNDPSGGARFTLLLPRTEADHAETARRR